MASRLNKVASYVSGTQRLLRWMLCHTVEFLSSISISSASAPTTSSEMTQARAGHRDSSGSRLATQSVVFRSSVPTTGRSVAPSEVRRLTPARSIRLPKLRSTVFDGVAIETARYPFCSDSYHVKGQEAASGKPTAVFSLSRLLCFLQGGFSAGLRLGSLKVQVSALSFFF